MADEADRFLHRVERALLLLFWFVAAPPALAVVACTYTAATDALALTMNAANDSITLSVGGTGNDKILVNGSPTSSITGCVVDADTGATNDTDIITVLGDINNNQNLTISEAGPGGAFPADIEFTVNLGTGTGEDLVIVGRTTADNIIFGAASLATGTATGEGSDTLTAVETLVGSRQADNLTGGGLGDTLVGGGGDDRISGGGGNDTTRGGRTGTTS